MRISSPPSAPDSSRREAPAWRGLAADPVLSTATAASETALFAAGFFGAQLIIFIAGVFQKRLLGPGAFGVWTILGVVWSFFALASMGASAGASREVPAFRGARDFDRAGRAANTGASFGVLAFAGLGIVVAAAALVFGRTWSSNFRWGLLLVGVIAPLRVLVDTHTDLLRLTRRFRVLAIGLVANALLVLTVQTALVAALGLWGMFAGLIVVSLATLALWSAFGLTSFRRPAFRWQLDRAMLKHLALVGIPVTIYSNLWILFTSIDSLLVAAFLDVRHVGYYSIAVSVTSYVLFLPRVVSGALFPRMQERFSAADSIDSIRHYAIDVPRLLAYLFVPLLLVLSFYLLPVLVRHAMPSFTPGIPAVRVAVASSFFLSLADMPIEFMITAGHRWKITALMLASLLVNVAANVVVLGPFHGGLVGAAAATGIAYFVLFVTMTLHAVTAAAGRAAAILQVLRLTTVGAWVVGTLWAVESVVGTGGGSTAADAGLALLKVCLALLVLSPLALLAELRYKPFATLLQMSTRLLTRGRRQRHAT